jgi:pyruvate ferredoxin oxidoreductase gamma subunit
MEKMLEVRWHGRGGQGAWTASELLARAAIHEGKFIQSFPEFGPERMGAPVTAFTRISDKSIMVHCMVYNPDVVAVLDPTLIKAVPVIEGLNEEGNVIVNSTDSPANVKRALKADKGNFWTVPATEIAIKTLGRPIMNTALLGAVVRVTGIVSLESVERVVKERFTQNIAEKNIAVVKQAYEEAKSE